MAKIILFSLFFVKTDIEMKNGLSHIIQFKIIFCTLKILNRISKNNVFFLDYGVAANVRWPTLNTNNKQ